MNAIFGEDKAGSSQSTVSPTYGFLSPSFEPHRDIPIVFVSADSESDSDEWEKLPAFWNPVPHPSLGARTIHLGQSPLGAAAAIFATDQMQTIKIKVPRGLPDPTPFIPASNPPTYRKWLLGKQLFFERNWLMERRGISCSFCHKPDHGYTYPDEELREDFNPPSLINCVYNRHQFWDGRAVHLEEVLQKRLSDEKPGEAMKKQNYDQKHHSFGGLIPRLSSKKAYIDRFKTVFGVSRPTTDTIAKALATYMRTILSGDSIYDRALRLAKKDEANEIHDSHFESVLTGDVLKKLQRKPDEKSDVAEELAYGYQLFFQKGCNECHSGWNFTDNSFHNVGIRESSAIQKPGEETGHFPYVPYGLKDKRMVGAFSTPSLRALPRTNPYFHDAGKKTLEDVVKYYNEEIESPVYNRYIDPKLIGDDRTKPLQLDITSDGERALALFLHSLDGQPVDPIITSPPGK